MSEDVNPNYVVGLVLRGSLVIVAHGEHSRTSVKLLIRLFWIQASAGDAARIAKCSCNEGRHSSGVVVCNERVPRFFLCGSNHSQNVFNNLFVERETLTAEATQVLAIFIRHIPMVGRSTQT